MDISFIHRSNPSGTLRTGDMGPAGRLCGFGEQLDRSWSQNRSTVRKQRSYSRGASSSPKTPKVNLRPSAKPGQMSEKFGGPNPPIGTVRLIRMTRILANISKPTASSPLLISLSETFYCRINCTSSSHRRTRWHLL